MYYKYPKSDRPSVNRIYKQLEDYEKYYNTQRLFNIALLFTIPFVGKLLFFLNLI